MRIGILEDEPDHASQLVGILASDGHSCHVLATGSDFFHALARDSYDLLILDWMVPDTTGLKVLVTLRERSIATPVIFVTGRDAESDIVGALRAGADDYLIKPPRPAELLARIEVLRRRVAGDDDRAVLAHPYRFDLNAGEAWLGEERLELTARQLDLAAFLFRQPGHLFSRTHLLEAVWGVGTHVQTRTLDIHVSQLRGLLRLGPEHGWRIASVYGHGYRLERTNESD
jgi:DNA-binding response OmpR family regulator